MALTQRERGTATTVSMTSLEAQAGHRGIQIDHKFTTFFFLVNADYLLYPLIQKLYRWRHPSYINVLCNSVVRMKAKGLLAKVPFRRTTIIIFIF